MCEKRGGRQRCRAAFFDTPPWKRRRARKGNKKADRTGKANRNNKTNRRTDMEKKIEQPDEQFQRLLDSVLSEEKTDVMFRGRRHSIGWMKKGTMRKFSHVCLKEKDESKRNMKICALMLLNSKWKILFLYWAYWRWLYYVCEVDDAEVLRLCDTAKKKIPSLASSLLTILATGMTDLMMTMTAKEAESTQAARTGARPTR